jgi:hypothetical protein
MTSKKLIKQLTDLFDVKKSKLCKRKDEIKKLLKQLRKKERDLIASAKEEKNEKKRLKMERHIRVVHSQRLKGLNNIKKINCDG